MGVLVSEDDVTDYLSSPVVLDTMDDDNDGEIDPSVLARVVGDSEAMVFAAVRGIYELPLTPPIDPLLVTVSLQLVHCQLVRRFPERFRRNLTICKDAKELLGEIRSGDMQLAHALTDNSRAPGVDSLPARGYERIR